MNRSTRSFVLSFLAVLCCHTSGCHGGSGVGSKLGSETGIRVSGVRTAGGEGDALAAALLLGVGYPVARPGRAEVRFGDAALRDELLGMSTSHVYATAFTAAAGGGQMGSAYVRRLALAPGAPADRNGNGTNLDETLARHYDELARRAGGVVPGVLRPTLFPWRDGSAEFAAAVDPKSPSQRTRDGQVGLVDMAQVGHAMLARTMLAAGLLEGERTGPGGTRLPGATPERGVLGLMLLQQVLAMEETVFGNLFMNGTVLSGMQFPTDYEPAQGKRWLPRAIRVSRDPRIPELVTAFAISDRSSSLEALAAMMRAGAELSFLASPANPSDALHDVLSGFVFGKLPDPEPSASSANEIVTWEDGVGELLGRICVFCHDSNFPPEPGLFAADSYDHVHRGGRNSRPGSKTPIITRGDPENSVLYYVLLDTPPAPFYRMPDGGPYLSPEEVSLIRRWIEDGAHSAPPGPPRVGIDLAVTMFKNLVAMHVGFNGELYERHDGDAPVQFTNPAATGAALQALAAMSHLSGELKDYRPVLDSVASFAATNLTTPGGDVARSFDTTAGVASGSADVFGHARMVAGLFAAARVLGSPSLRGRAEVVARAWLDRFFDSVDSVFRSEAGAPGARFTPVVLAAVVDALREMAAAGVADSAAVLESFLKKVRPALVFSELSTGGEVLGDGVADTDGNGIREPALAGGEFGLAPVFSGEILDGAPAVPAESAITWSRHIQPLFRNKCGTCHMDGSTRGDGYLLDTPALARRAIHRNNPLQLVAPFDPEGSFLYRKLVDRTPSIGEQMPLQTPPLSPAGKALVRQWILEGATNR